MKRGANGFTLIEIAIVLVIIGLLLGGVLKGQELITGARVRNLISQQDGIKAAFFGFQDRYRALPGDYRDATTSIACNPACPGGNGNGRIEDGGTPRESILVWAHLAGAGFLNTGFSATSATVTPAPGNTPQNIFGAYMQVAFDSLWGFSTNPASRHNIKTGAGIPVDAIAEMDRKVDDGAPTSGRFQFSPYGSLPLKWGGMDDSCTNQDIADPGTTWNANSGVDDCGAVTLF
jgi:prepilin-type N-terminal cleavage/methylation domain-containing protein